LFAFTLIIAATAVKAQVPAPAPPARPRTGVPSPASAYCLPASVAFLESDAKASDEVQKCARGDTVVIPSRNASAVASGENVVCVLVFPERISK
jgi:putative hemolysin